MIMNCHGILIGLSSFLIIGIFHPLVIKSEYYFGQKSKWWFAVVGVIICILSIIVNNIIISSLLGVTAFSCFWSIKEIKEQRQRVARGWFPANPKREKK